MNLIERYTSIGAGADFSVLILLFGISFIFVWICGGIYIYNARATATKASKGITLMSVAGIVLDVLSLATGFSMYISLAVMIPAGLLKGNETTKINNKNIDNNISPKIGINSIINPTIIPIIDDARIVIRYQ